MVSLTPCPDAARYSRRPVQPVADALQFVRKGLQGGVHLRQLMEHEIAQTRNKDLIAELPEFVFRHRGSSSARREQTIGDAISATEMRADIRQSSRVPFEEPTSPSESRLWNRAAAPEIFQHLAANTRFRDNRRMSRDGISYFARTNHRTARVPFGIKQTDRLSHMYVIGKTGVGKSTLLETLAWQDFEAGRGFALVDPHGDLVEELAGRMRIADPERIVYLDACDPWLPYGYNPLRRVREDKIPLAVTSNDDGASSAAGLLRGSWASSPVVL